MDCSSGASVMETSLGPGVCEVGVPFSCAATRASAADEMPVGPSTAPSPARGCCPVCSDIELYNCGVKSVRNHQVVSGSPSAPCRWKGRIGDGGRLLVGNLPHHSSGHGHRLAGAG